MNATRLGPSVCAAIVVALATPGRAAHGQPLESRRGAVAADDHTASQVGAVALLRRPL